MKELIISKNERKIAVLVQNGKLVEQYEETESVLEGNIYCGVVKDVLPGMQAAFVDIGEDKNAFIHIKDIVPKVSSQTGNKLEEMSKYKIKDYIKQGDTILVQIRKDEVEKKGARITKHISLTGRLTVLEVDNPFVTLSQKIENKDERKRLKDIAKSYISNYKNEKYGIILRTGAEGKNKKEIENDIKELIDTWQEIKKKYSEISKLKKATIIYKNRDVITKFLVRILETDIDEITVNDKVEYDKVKKYLNTINNKTTVVTLKENENVLTKYDVDTQLEKMNDRKIWLNCGGFITIDKTEALTAIDVNSGKFTGNKKMTKENTIVKVNKEATIEIAKQLRLRNISGIIVIDYIDMEEEKDKDEIINLLKNELKKDRSKTQIEGFTKLDLLEMTRKKL